MGIQVSVRTAPYWPEKLRQQFHEDIENVRNEFSRETSILFENPLELSTLIESLHIHIFSPIYNTATVNWVNIPACFTDTCSSSTASCISNTASSSPDNFEDSIYFPASPEYYHHVDTDEEYDIIHYIEYGGDNGYIYVDGHPTHPPFAADFYVDYDLPSLESFTQIEVVDLGLESNP